MIPKSNQVNETLVATALVGRTAQIRLAGVGGLEARGKAFQDMHAAYGLKHIVEEGDAKTGLAALKALRRLVKSES
jgi:hypothetical protein